MVEYLLWRASFDFLFFSIAWAYRSNVEVGSPSTRLMNDEEKASPFKVNPP